MGFSCGIVGLPNVGKSTLFNALTRAGVEASNYPFCTIDPNVGIVNVPDERLYRLAELNSSKKTIPTTVEFVDIAGLVKGAAQGEGLGNQFLTHIRNVDAIVQVVRLFEDPDIIHIGEVDPTRDVDIINMELILKDLEQVEGQIAKKQKLVRAGDKVAETEMQALEKVKEGLGTGLLVKNISLNEEEKKAIRPLQLLTDKEFLLVGNTSEDGLADYTSNPYYQKLAAKAAELCCDVVVLSARIEQELTELDQAEAKEYLAGLGQNESGLETLIREGYKLLGLITFFTAGEKETRAWTITRGMKAPQAAGRIHSDMERGFIRGEIVAYQDFVSQGSWAAVRDKGLLRQEGKEYVMQDGDIMIVRFSV